MELIADLHLHSKYSRAVSQRMIIPEITKWARKKGINLVGAPDWTHPLWVKELRRDLKEVGEGVYAYREDLKGPRFLLVTEIASIYSQGGKGRRIHTLFFAPSFSVVEAINQKLSSRQVKLMSDGRPITSLSSVEICELVFSISKDCLVIPAHAWTPWFSLYGSRSGFDSIKECFGQFTDQIYAIETGLSSDPAMNWRIKELDKRSIVSFSDAHSPRKLGREATVLTLENTEKVSYEEIKKAIINEQIAYTIEFYPEEGKYHYTGHRHCGIKQSPEETKKLGTTCPVCGKPLTVGVMHRVEQLASRSSDFRPAKRPDYKMLVPLMEILAESLGYGFSSQIVETEYNRLIAEFVSEFNVLLNVDIREITKVSGEKVAEGLRRVREREILIDPGYDGVFGTVKIWQTNKEKEGQKQMALF